jgi:hypothetical protein
MARSPDSAPTVIPAPSAPLGRTDPTRRFALDVGPGPPAFPGLARDEAEDLAAALPARTRPDTRRFLVRVTLPVLLSDGAGPHLLDDAGRLTLALADHPQLAGLRVAMGEASPGHRIGVVAPREEPRLWQWEAEAIVAPARRLEALELLDQAVDAEALARWQSGERRRAAREHG